MKIVRLFEDQMLQYEEKVIQELGLDVSIDVRVCQTEAEIIQNAQDADVLITVYEPLTQHVLDNLPNLKLVLYRSVGVNNIDLTFANQLKLPVSHLVHYCTDEVANYVVAAILMHNRRIHDFNQVVKVRKQWDSEHFLDMHRLFVQTVGLIGFGNIPRLVAKRMQAFGCQILAYDPFVAKDVFSKAGVQSVSLEELFTDSDYISSHLPLTPQTKGVLNQNLFASTKKAPVFINASRGGVVNEKDLVTALHNGHISYAILDVLASEDPDLEQLPFIPMENVLLTPHIAFYSQEALLQGVRENLENLQAYLRQDYQQAGLVNAKEIDL